METILTNTIRPFSSTVIYRVIETLAKHDKAYMDVWNKNFHQSLYKWFSRDVEMTQGYNHIYDLMIAKLN